MTISLSQATSVWAKIGLTSFGGPAGQIALMHRELVEKHQWISEERFLNALNFCMLLPGPEAQQLSIYLGWLMHKTRGGLIAGLLFILPGFLCILLLSLLYVMLGNSFLVGALFFGLKAAVLAVVLQAIIRIARRTTRNTLMLGIAIASFSPFIFFTFLFPSLSEAPVCWALPDKNFSRPHSVPLLTPMLLRKKTMPSTSISIRKICRIPKHPGEAA